MWEKPIDNSLQGFAQQKKKVSSRLNLINPHFSQHAFIFYLAGVINMTCTTTEIISK